MGRRCYRAALCQWHSEHRDQQTSVSDALSVSAIGCRAIFPRTLNGPTVRAMAALTGPQKAGLRKDLVELWERNNSATNGTTFVEAQYLEVIAVRAGSTGLSLNRACSCAVACWRSKHRVKSQPWLPVRSCVSALEAPGKVSTVPARAELWIDATVEPRPGEGRKSFFTLCTAGKNRHDNARRAAPMASLS